MHDRKTRAINSWIGVTFLLSATAVYGSANPLYDQAIEAFRNGDFRSAAHRLEQLVDESPSWTAGLVTLGQSYLMLGEIEKAEHYMTEARKVDPEVDLYRAFWIPGNLLYRDGRYDAAVGALELALEHAPDAEREETSLRLSHAMLLKGDHVTARAHLVDHLARFGADYKAFYYLGLACRSGDDMGCALENLRQARRIDPQRATAFQERVAKWSRFEALRMEEGERRRQLLEGALEDSRLWMRNDPENRTAQEYYANNLLSLGEAERLIEEFRLIAEKNPENCAAPLFVARGYNRRKDGVRAAEWARTATSCDPGSAAAHAELAAGLIHQLEGTYESIDQVRAAQQIVRQARAAARLSVELSSDDNRLAKEIVSESDKTMEHLRRAERELIAADEERQAQMQATIRERCKVLWWKSRTEGQELTQDEARYFEQHRCSRHAPKRRSASAG